ncbi:MAG: hypothetical protein AAFN11_06565 [Chloroflexota bacterium]
MSSQLQSDTQLQALLSAFGITENDLLLFRDRRIAEERREAILQERRKKTFFYIGRAVIFTLLLMGLGVLWMWADSDGILSLIGLGLVIIMPAVAYFTQRKVWREYQTMAKQTTVSSLEGTAQLVERHSQRIHFYGVRVRGHLFHLTKAQHALLQNNRDYCVYYLQGQSEFPIAIEPLD